MNHSRHVLGLWRREIALCAIKIWDVHDTLFHHSAFFRAESCKKDFFQLTGSTNSTHGWAFCYQVKCENSREQIAADCPTCPPKKADAEDGGSRWRHTLITMIQILVVSREWQGVWAMALGSSPPPPQWPLHLPFCSAPLLVAPPLMTQTLSITCPWISSKLSTAWCSACRIYASRLQSAPLVFDFCLLVLLCFWIMLGS